MVDKKNEAFKLRVKGHSYNEINSKLDIPKSTLSGWFKDLVLSDDAIERLNKRKGVGTEVLVKRNKLQTKKAWDKASEIQKESAQKIRKLSKHELALVGAALYWGEGYKKLKVKNGKKVTHHQISFVNADPDMVMMFTKFLLEILEIDRSRVRVGMRLYEHINERNALEYWQKVTGFPKKNFEKTTWLVSSASKGKRPYKRLPYGTVAVRVGDTENFHRIIGLIEGLKKSATL